MPSLPYPGVTITEIDRSAAPARVATGVPAGVVGTAEAGPAFIPLTYSSVGQFASQFGDSGTRFGPIAVNLWLNSSLNGNATYLRVLGVGDGNRRSLSTGAVTNAGFVVGEQQVLDSGIVGANPYANSGGVLGRTYFLGCYMSESAGSTYFSSAGLQDSEKALPIIRGVVMTPSGVSLTLSGNSNSSNAPDSVATDGGAVSGSITFADSSFVLLLNGHIGTAQYPNVLTASLSSVSQSFFANTLNRDPRKFQQAGHYLYTWYDVPDVVATITGSQILANPTSDGDVTKQDAVFITSASIGRNTSSATTPNYEQFRERYTHPVSPYVVSQDYGGTKYDLFRVHAISDGALSTSNSSPDLSKNYKITIGNIKPADDANAYATFDLEVRRANHLDEGGNPLKVFPGLTFDPNSLNYIAAVIGDQSIYFDFDRGAGSQKIVVQGDYPVTNEFIRVELSEDFLAGNVPLDAIPAGYRGYGFIQTAGSELTTFTASTTQILAGEEDILTQASIPPVPMRSTIAVGASPNATVNPDLTWGTKFESTTSLTEPNTTAPVNAGIESFIRFFPSYDLTGKKFFIDNSPEADSFCNNLFTIENIQVVTGAYGDQAPESILWPSASYIRQGNIVADDTNKTRALTVEDLKDTFSANRQNVYFTFFLQGGFDGTNIFNAEKANLTDLAAKREIDDPANQGGINGPTVAAYKKAIDIMGSTADVNIQLLTIPGIRVPAITNYAISAVENRFDALYLMDIEQRSELNTYVTSSAQTVSVMNTVTDFRSRGLNTSFAAAYFPDVTISLPGSRDTVQVPPSAAALASYALNDTFAPWYAPAGVTRGTIPAVAGGLSVPLSENSTTLGTIYDADINPIVQLSSTGQTVLWGQKTLLRTASSLDRVNVRRLLIDVRRRVRAVANTLLFEPNTQATLARFNALVNPILQDVQNRSGVTRYKVAIDTSTTTQADIDNNTIRGKIWLQPVRTAEFISVDFVVNASSAV